MFGGKNICLYYTFVSQKLRDMKTDSTGKSLSSTSPENKQKQTGGIFNKISYVHAHTDN